MSSLEVVFNVPQWIDVGLKSGAFKRVGGVIVQSASKQVVAWLRDGSAVNTALDVAGSLPTPFALIAGAARSAITLWDGKMTRDAVRAVGQQVDILQQQSQLITVLSGFTATGQLVNLALSAATFYATIQRLDKLSEEVAKLGEVVRAEFARDRDTRFRTALEAARDVFESSKLQHRESAVRTSVDGLYEARENFLLDFTHALSGEITDDKLLIAQHYLIRAQYAEISRIRCYIAADDLELAKRRLAESVPMFTRKSHLLISHWLGKHPAIFLHKDVPAEDMDRFLLIQRWMHNDDPFSTDDDARVIFNVLNSLREDFWNSSVIQDEYGDTLSKLTRRPVRSFSDRMARLIDKLTHVEVIIENHQRLCGFELELRSMRLNFDEWGHLVSEADLREHGVALIVDTEAAHEAA